MFSYSASLFSQSETLFQQFQSRSIPGLAAQTDSDVGASLNQGLKKGLGVELDEQSVKPTPKGFDIDKVVDTVMTFVEQRIVGARADGASDTELQGMFDAAREGVKQGFAEARDQINALNKMNDRLANNIDTAESKIYEGVDQLEQRILAPQVQVEPGTQASDSGSDQGSAAPALNRVSYLDVKQEQSESFSFSLTTQDGDTVDISAFYNQSFSAEAMRARGEGGSAVRYAGFDYQQSGGFDLVVQGSLDDDEKQAIADLLVQVEELATEFYQGDLQTAFEMALEISADPEEIAQFSLNLKQQQSTAIEYGAYRSGRGAYAQDALPRGLSEPLANFAEGVREAFNEAVRFSEPSRLLEDLFEQFDRSGQINRLASPLLTLLENTDS